MYNFLLITFPMIMQLRIGPNMLAFCFNYSPTTCNNIKESPFELDWLHDQNFLFCVVSILTGLFLIGLILKSVTLRQAVVAEACFSSSLLIHHWSTQEPGNHRNKIRSKEILYFFTGNGCFSMLASHFWRLFNCIVQGYRSLPKLRSRLGSQCG